MRSLLQAIAELFEYAAGALRRAGQKEIAVIPDRVLPIKVCAGIDQSATDKGAVREKLIINCHGSPALTNPNEVLHVNLPAKL